MVRPERVLVLGASGFFGRWICHELEASGFELTRSRRHEGGPDLLDAEALRRLIARERPSAVVNAAGMTSPAAALVDPAKCFSVNTEGVLNLLEALRLEAPDSHLVALSSAAVLTGEPPFDELAAIEATGPYSASKLAMEILCGQYSRSPGLAITVLRCFNLTGPGEPATQATSEFVLAAIAAGKGGQTTIEVGTPETARDFTDIRDAAKAVARTLESSATGTFNLCSGEARSLAWLAATIGHLTGTELSLRGSGTGRPASGLSAISGDNDKLRMATGWEPETELKQSLADLVAWRRDEA